MPLPVRMRLRNYMRSLYNFHVCIQSTITFASAIVAFLVVAALVVASPPSYMLTELTCTFAKHSNVGIRLKHVDVTTKYQGA